LRSFFNSINRTKSEKRRKKDMFRN